jgi:tetratricopeptide (TPR) repeat protein
MPYLRLSVELPSFHFVLRATLVAFAIGGAPSAARGQSAEALLRFHLAQEARRHGDDARAAEWLSEAVRLDPAAPLPRIEWAAALLAIGDPSAAETALDPLASWWDRVPAGEDELAARYAHLKAAAAARRGSPDDAIVWYERAVLRAPRDLGLRAQLIGHYRARGDEEAALLHLRATAAALPDNGDLQVELGHTLLVLARWEEAEAAFAHAVAVQPRLEQGWDGLGVARTLRGDYAGAEEALREGLRVAPRSASIYEHLGDALLGDGRAGDALVAYQRAATLAPDQTHLVDKIDRARAALPR